MASRPSSLFLVIANLLPLAGVLWFEWSVVNVLLLYWAETVVIGVINVLRIASCRSEAVVTATVPVPPMNRTASLRFHHLPRVPDNAIKLFLVPFFIVHFGAFCLAHLSAIVGLFTPEGLDRKLGAALPDLWHEAMWWSLAIIAGSRLYSYYANFIRRREYLRTNPMSLMQRPYGRVMIMHLSIIIGGGLVAWIGEPMQMIVVLVAAKTLVDLNFHEKERRILLTRY